MSQHAHTQIFTITNKADDRLVAQFNGQGQVLSSAPTLKDRQQWRTVKARMQQRSQPAKEATVKKEAER